MKVIMTGGGTGGHIYPAVAIADKIKEKDPDAEILFVGTRRGLESRLVPKNGYPIKYITVSGFNRKNMLKNIKTMKDLAKGMHEAKKIIKEFRPDAVIGTGGYVCGPVVRTAAKMKIPSYIHEQNAFPGLTNRMLEKSVDRVFIAFREAGRYFKHSEKLIVTGNPVRQSFFNAKRDEARKKLGMNENDFIILSFGGSRGAGKINEVVGTLAETLSGRKGTMLIYCTGSLYYDEVKEKTKGLEENIKVIEYIDNMDLYLAAADLVISRSGALTVTEITVCGRASILIPSPNVTGNHQYYNAKAVADAGGAVLINESDFTPEKLEESVTGLMNDRKKLSMLEEGSRNAAPGDAAEIIYNRIFG